MPTSGSVAICFDEANGSMNSRSSPNSRISVQSPLASRQDSERQRLVRLMTDSGKCALSCDSTCVASRSSATICATIPPLVPERSKFLVTQNTDQEHPSALTATFLFPVSARFNEGDEFVILQHLHFFPNGHRERERQELGDVPAQTFQLDYQ